jgi:hypothetical protein
VVPAFTFTVLQGGFDGLKGRSFRCALASLLLSCPEPTLVGRKTRIMSFPAVSPPGRNLIEFCGPHIA